MLAVAYESFGQSLPQVSEKGHSRSPPVWFEACGESCPELLILY